MITKLKWSLNDLCDVQPGGESGAVILRNLDRFGDAVPPAARGHVRSGRAGLGLDGEEANHAVVVADEQEAAARVNLGRRGVITAFLR